MQLNIQEEIKTHYGDIAKRVTANAKSSCCSSGDCCGDRTNDTELYTAEYIAGLPTEAINASLGCANPIVLANLQKGETVLDLGSGGGIDVLISAKFVGDTGKAYGLDMTDEMLELANRNKAKIGATNVEFIKGYIENIPLAEESVDVVTSNCVINLTENKEIPLAEAYRVLKKGGRLAIADIVELKDIPEESRKNVELWVSCFSGALTIQEYERILKKLGFHDVETTLVSVYEQMEDAALNGVFGSAHVKAYK